MTDTAFGEFDFCDTIAIDKLVVKGKHGVTKAERDQELPLELSILLKVDLSQPAQSDDVDDTVNYSALHSEVVKVVETRSRQLLERLAMDILDVLFTNERIIAARVSISKPGRLGGSTPTITLARRNRN